MKKAAPLIIILTAFVIVVIVSFMPLSKWTDGRIKDFSPVSDILKETGVMDGEPSYAKEENIDPELLRAEKESAEATGSQDGSGSIDTIVSPVKPSRVGDMVMIEDYTTHESGFAHLKSALNSGRLARIAVVGDSYIEGDIFTQDLREHFQSAYGGEGVGYVNMHSDFPGFRRSVKQGGSGWKTFAANKKADKEYLYLAEHYSVPTGTATSTYEGSSAYEHTKSWSRSRFLFISPEDITISVKTDGQEWEERNIAGSDSVQCIEIAQKVSNLGIKTSAPSLIGLGVWLDGTTGVSLDCMSSRGFSGITLTRINPRLCSEMSEFINYDLIILEFGINAMSAKQTDYSIYSSRMVNVINHVRSCYPHADILLMGVGDRGERHGSQVKSMTSAPYMISAQRDAARRAHCMFWDTREAMGGEDAVVTWSSTGLINKDYIHLTHKGGGRLADELFNAIQHELK